MCGRRLTIVKEAFAAISPECTGSITVAQARACFAYEEFDKWCEVIGVPCEDDKCIPWEQFCDFYTDISMAVFDEKSYI